MLGKKGKKGAFKRNMQQKGALRGSGQRARFKKAVVERSMKMHPRGDFLYIRTMFRSRNRPPNKMSRKGVSARGKSPGRPFYSKNKTNKKNPTQKKTPMRGAKNVPHKGKLMTSKTPE